MTKRGIRFTGEPSRFNSLKDLLSSPPPKNGSVEVQYPSGIPLHFYYHDRGARTTLVTFHPAVSPNVENLPAYSGMGVTRNMKVNRLFFSDPSLILDTELRLGWYAGNMHQPSLQNDIAEIIQHLVQAQRVVLFGASGGGFAALEQTIRLQNGVTAIVSNPQTNIFNYYKPASDRYLETAWGMTGEDSIPFRSSVVDAYKGPIDSKIIYLQNSGDSYHVNRHMIPFLDHLHPSNNVEVVTPFIGKGHVGPNKEVFTELLRKICIPDSFESLSTLSQSIKYTS